MTLQESLDSFAAYNEQNTKDLQAAVAAIPEKIEAAKRVGALIAEKAISREIKKVVFDRNGFLYHGRVKALADAAREKGLEF